MEALSAALPADFPASCFADDFPRGVARPARIWWRCLSASSAGRHSIATSRTKSKFRHACPSNDISCVELTLDLDLKLGWVQAWHKRLADDGCGTSFECPTRITGNVFTASVRSTVVASDPMVTRRHTSESPVHHSACLAKVSRRWSSCSSVHRKRLATGMSG